jgi:hypothetical protein
MIIDRYGYVFCHVCKRSDKKLDISLTRCVKFEQKNRSDEVAFEIQNIKGRCRDCHDKLDAKKNAAREAIYQRERESILR